MIDFVLLATPRTGSNHLCSLLNSAPGVVMHYELFHPHKVFFTGQSQACKQLGSLTPDERNADPVAFLNRVKAADSHVKVGFKLFPNHADKFVRQLVQAPGVRKLVLHRENVLAVYASNERAKVEGKYHAHGATGPGTLVQFKADDFKRFHDKYVQWYAQIGTLATDAGEPFFFLPYAQISNPHVTAAAIHHVTGRTPRTELRSAHVKTGSKDIMSRFENADDVSAYLSKIGRDDWRFEAA